MKLSFKVEIGIMTLLKLFESTFTPKDSIITKQIFGFSFCELCKISLTLILKLVVTSDTLLFDSLSENLRCKLTIAFHKLERAIFASIFRIGGISIK